MHTIYDLAPCTNILVHTVVIGASAGWRTVPSGPGSHPVGVGRDVGGIKVDNPSARAIRDKEEDQCTKRNHLGLDRHEALCARLKDLKLGCFNKWIFFNISNVNCQLTVQAQKLVLQTSSNPQIGIKKTSLQTTIYLRI